MGYLTVFIYEVMHETVCVKYRNETDRDDPNRIQNISRDLRIEHDNSLQQLVARWNPGVESSIVGSMRLSSDSCSC